MRQLLTILLFTLISTATFAQTKVIDEVVANIGDEIILRSEVEVQLMQMRDVKEADIPTARCFILDQLMQRKLMLVRAKADSLKVSEDQVTNELERRIQYMIANPQIGSAEKLEEYFGKSIIQIKNEFRKTIKEQILIEQMQAKATSNADLTPNEIRTYFKTIPPDSLPLYNTEVELSQLVIFPKPTKEAKLAAIQKLKDIREEVQKGANFGTKAVVYSQDNGSAIKRGDLGMTAASQFVPEFSAAALKLKKDSMSGIVESKFGYHLIQMIERKGDMIHTRHILLKAEVTEDDNKLVKARLDSFRQLILDKKATLQTLSQQFSEDEESKNRGGMMVDPKTNASKVPLDELDAATFYAIDKLKPGEFSDPAPYTSMDGREGFRLVFLKSKTPQHKANLTDDYPKIKLMALEANKNAKLQAWYDKYIPITYIKVNPPLKSCESMAKWTAKNGK
ncbi:MAG: peptidylprolyl isomerase [Bacteroidetes bacterium]|nr:peptidylprolyl isomerase [Bacteroidota bacterium]